MLGETAITRTVSSTSNGFQDEIEDDDDGDGTSPNGPVARQQHDRVQDQT